MWFVTSILYLLIFNRSNAKTYTIPEYSPTLSTAERMVGVDGATPAFKTTKQVKKPIIKASVSLIRSTTIPKEAIVQNTVPDKPTSIPVRRATAAANTQSTITEVSSNVDDGKSVEVPKRKRGRPPKVKK